MASPRDPTQFTLESAERIANVVRAAELSVPEARPLSFAREDFFRNRKIFRICTFTGAWPTGVEKVITFKYQTATPNTASAVNLFFPVTSTATGSTDCAIAKDGTAWFLIDVPFESASTTVMTDVTLSASLNTSACTISIGKTLVTASISYLRLKV